MQQLRSGCLHCSIAKTLILELLKLGKSLFRHFWMLLGECYALFFAHNKIKVQIFFINTVCTKKEWTFRFYFYNFNIHTNSKLNMWLPYIWNCRQIQSFCFTFPFVTLFSSSKVISNKKCSIVWLANEKVCYQQGVLSSLLLRHVLGWYSIKHEIST